MTITCKCICVRMYMYVYVYVYVCVCICICVHVCVHTVKVLCTISTNLIGSFHMISQASRLLSIGAGRFVGMSLMDDISPPQRSGWGIPPWTQNICTRKQ